MWRRFIRSRGFILLIITVIFSFGILGQVDNRMHIGGSDWDLNGLIYINVDEYLLDGSVSYTDQNTPLVTEKSQVSLDGITGTLPPLGNKDSLPAVSAVEIAGEETISDVQVTSGEVVPEESTRQETTPPAVAAPKVEEKKQEQRPPILVHKVRSGETLWDIATAYGISVDTIIASNSLANPNRISIGQELQIPSVNGVLHQVASGESLWEIAERYKVSIDIIAKENGINDPSRLQPNTKLVIPGATRLQPRDVILVNGQLQKAFDWPVKGRISSTFGPRWGKMHNGLDIAVSTGTQVKAAADGRVTFAGWNGGYGILVIVDHGNGVETRYAHNSRLNVKVGQKVERGQVVAYSGNTGVSTGPHVHFEIRQRNNPVNPQTYLK